MNEKNRRNLKALMDLLSDSHHEMAILAADINTVLLKIDEEPGKSSAIRSRIVGRKFGELAELLDEQALRVSRTAAEVRQLKKKVKSI
jgi:hypothetical protein